MRMIIDTDAGVDDAQALMMALTHPGTTVNAITAVSGNVHVAKVIPNIFTILQAMNRTVPVYRGADRPLLYDWQHAEHVHGSDGLGDWAERPHVAGKVEKELAAQALVRLANESPGELTLVALGPLTNIALAAHLDPTFPSKIKRFIFMGGTIAAHGNTANVTAEFNIQVDPEAAYMTLRAFPEATMLSWETTIQHPLSDERYRELKAINSEAGRFFNSLISAAEKVLSKLPRRFSGHLLPDPLAMAVALEPELIKGSERYFVTVELNGSHTRGQTVIDYRSAKGQLPNVEIVTVVDMDGVFRLLKQSLA